jgi:amino acid adenylation domain-containing protein
MERGQGQIVSALATLKAGAAYIPLDPNYPKARIGGVLEDARANALLTQQNMLERLPDCKAKIICLDLDWALVDENDGSNPNIGALPTNLAYVIYTSGSTGKPKGVQISHASLVNLSLWHHRVYNISCADRATQLAGLSFDASIWEVWPYLTAGASVNIPGEESLSSPASLVDYLAREDITISFLPTPLAALALEEPWPESIPLRLMLTGGDRLNRAPKPHLPFTLANNYGPTENTVVATWTLVAPTSECDDPPSIGRPIFNSQAYLLYDNLQPVPVGAPGQIHIGGHGLARGYLNQPELTAEKFVPNPFAEHAGGRLYKTGDLGRYRIDGNIDFLSRFDDQVKIRGVRIELGEIEAELAQLPCVREAAVLARQDDAGQMRLVAYVVLKPEAAGADLITHMKEKLPDYMLPAAFVTLNALPTTPNGKLDRNALPIPSNPDQGLEASYMAPRTPEQEIIGEILADLLGIERMSLHDNFFALGGHSLLAMKFIGRAHKTFRVTLSLREFFENPTIAELSEAIEDALIKQIETLNDEEVRTLIGDQLDANIEERNVEATRI